MRCFNRLLCHMHTFGIATGASTTNAHLYLIADRVNRLTEEVRQLKIQMIELKTTTYVADTQDKNLSLATQAVVNKRE